MLSSWTYETSRVLNIQWAFFRTTPDEAIRSEGVPQLICRLPCENQSSVCWCTEILPLHGSVANCLRGSRKLVNHAFRRELLRRVLEALIHAEMQVLEEQWILQCLAGLRHSTALYSTMRKRSY